MIPDNYDYNDYFCSERYSEETVQILLEINILKNWLSLGSSFHYFLKMSYLLEIPIDECQFSFSFPKTDNLYLLTGF